MKAAIKTISMLLAIFMCGSLFACDTTGDVTESKPDTSSDEESTPAPTVEESTPSEEIIPDKPLDLFEVYQSNSITPSSCNYALKSSNGAPVKATFRGYYKIQEYGELEYKLYFSNNVDSTFADGSHSYRNMPTESYKIIKATVGTSKTSIGVGNTENVVTLTFDGSNTRDVKGGEMYWSDEFKLNVPKGHFLVFEWTVEYTVISATNSEGVACALFTEENGKLKETDAAPMPALIGCDRGNDLRVAFIGDSITMGIGAGNKDHKFWVAKVAELIGTDVSFWNLGLGYARADDAVNSPACLEKAKNNDVVVICFGVNDINSGPYKFSGQRSASQVANDIQTIAETCEAAGCKVIIFSTPPYTYANSQKVQVWRALQVKLKDLAESEGYDYFDFAAHLGTKADPSIPAYGGHPNAVGCAVVAGAFVSSGLIKIPDEE